jgi:hypothetical protein
MDVAPKLYIIQWSAIFGCFGDEKNAENQNLKY